MLKSLQKVLMNNEIKTVLNKELQINEDKL